VQILVASLAERQEIGVNILTAVTSKRLVVVDFKVLHGSAMLATRPSGGNYEGVGLDFVFETKR
jgi:hypothetical protein